MQTSHKEEYTDVYAGFFVRFVAFLLDCILVGIISLIVRGMFSAGLTDNNFMSTNVLFHYSILDIALYLLEAGYFIICTYSSGTTLGKYIMKLKVVDRDGNNLTFFNVLYRETIGRFLSSVFCIGYIMIIIDRENRSLHDRLCNTRVVYSCKIIKKVEFHQTEAYGVQKQPVNLQQQVDQEPSVNPEQPVNPEQQEMTEEKTKEA